MSHAVWVPCFIRRDTSTGRCQTLGHGEGTRRNRGKMGARRQYGTASPFGGRHSSTTPLSAPKHPFKHPLKCSAAAQLRAPKTPTLTASSLPLIASSVSAMCCGTAVLQKEVMRCSRSGRGRRRGIRQGRVRLEVQRRPAQHAHLKNESARPAGLACKASGNVASKPKTAHCVLRARRRLPAP